MPDPLWTLPRALALIRSLQPLAHAIGFHICLGGGVLNKGWSNKDLDLYFIPMDDSRLTDPGSVFTILAERDVAVDSPIGGVSASSTSRFRRKCRCVDGKNRRIDVFII